MTKHFEVGDYVSVTGYYRDGGLWGDNQMSRIAASTEIGTIKSITKHHTDFYIINIRTGTHKSLSVLYNQKTRRVTDVRKTRTTIDEKMRLYHEPDFLMNGDNFQIQIIDKEVF